MKIATIGILAGIVALIVVLVGASFFVYKKVVQPAMGSGAANEERLYATGLDAEATILEVHDAGFATKRYTQLELLLDVQPDGSKAFQAKTKQMISLAEAFLFQPGARLKVKYDPAHPGQIALVSSPVPAPAETKNSSKRLEELEKLREKGLISEDEYKKKREEILNSL